MSALFKCLLGLFVVMCFVQFIEMARVPRDDSAAKDLAQKLGELGPSINKIFEQESARLKEALNNEDFKKLMESGTQQFNQFLESFKNIGEKKA
ncbi:unnamed protein product [Ceratitis capitata]|uniref:(Mediterranean fruit fly) hypothetical protein n=1 Tax=Ceratitis capitata TaxID=7213 RepID=A0A811UNT7_CERCA|nr:unnamed protein product [Ceratitis capitata]